MVAQYCAIPFRGCLIIAAQEELAVAVGGDGFPLVLVERLDLADRLEDDRHAHVSAAHGGDEDRESWYLANVGELIQHAMQRNG